ncbi:TrmH family RNA methyltransferase [Corynebacterium aquatimens]|uniref:TrmH family RNA methyltransferase n=1 Tax=Corynebacterium aquatimens TaxID=1190508 RepID=A0A931GVP4_9CORY|nr:RNA methyltransferase [Corynebacterium aquatimens]MBG6121516.1 TrmH family RNA methyltransferase [Corynebacterium aquatimens]WJY65941.1 Putative TrmH family tRNA/rRNA methyltransferase [Corynebacterium aquatimens]
MALDFAEPFTERTPRVVNAAKLKRAAGRKKADRFLAEGFNAVDAAVATGAATDLFVTESAATEFAEIVTTADYMDVYTHAITDKAAEYLSDTVTTTGIFAVCRPALWTLPSIIKGKPKLIAVCVEAADPGNAGTIIRLADALGADAVLFAGDTVDPESPKVVRSTAGSLFHVPVVRDRDIRRALGQLRDAGLQLAATTMNGEVYLDEADEILEKPTAWLFGNEAHGLSDEVAQLADHRISIPIRGSAESLNLSTAAAICLWESCRNLGEEA